MRNSTGRAKPRGRGDDPRGRFRFASGLRFDLLYSLEVLLAASPGIHAAWRSAALAALPRSCRDDLAYFHGSAHLWVLLGDALGPSPPPDDMTGLMAQLEALSADEMQRSVLEGALHDARAAERVARGGMSLERALLEAPAVKREWLEHIDLYPPSLESPTLRALSRIAASAEESKARVLHLLDGYWRSTFSRTWAEIEPQLRRSREEKERLLQSCTLEEFFRLALLRVEADDRARCLRAIKGGYRLSYARIREAYVAPSAFNHQRFWTAFDTPEGTVVFLPYFDPAVAPAAGDPRPAGAPTPVDAPLVCKALGDPTRFAIATLIAREPATSADLAARLGLSRPTISHHIVLLREAGLLREEAAGGSIQLHLRREAIAALSDALLERLQGPSSGVAPSGELPGRREGRRGPRASAARTRRAKRR